jgi:hypothetical protein
MATRLNLMVDQGSDFRTTILLEDANGPINLTTYQARAEFRQHFSSVRSYPIDVQLANNGIVTLLLPASRTTNIRYGRYVYDVELTSNTGVVSRISEGILTLNPEVTRASANGAPVPSANVSFQFFGPTNTPYADADVFTPNAVLMEGSVVATPNTETVTLKWQTYNSETQVWSDITSGQGGFLVIPSGLEYTPSSTNNIQVRMFASTPGANAASGSAQFFYSPA